MVLFCVIFISMLCAGNQLNLIDVPPTPARSLSDLPSAKQDGRDVLSEREYKKLHYQKNKEKIHQSYVAWKNSQPDEYQKWLAKKREKNRQRYRDDHPWRDRQIAVRKKRERTPEHKQYVKDRSVKLRQEMLSAYGGKCTCCGESHHEFLTLEHIDSKGIHLGGSKMWLFLKKSGWPKDHYTILCWNCNCVRRFGKKCPHELERVHA